MMLHAFHTGHVKDALAQKGPNVCIFIFLIFPYRFCRHRGPVFYIERFLKSGGSYNETSLHASPE